MDGAFGAWTKDSPTHLRPLLPVLQRRARRRSEAADPVLLALWQTLAPDVREPLRHRGEVWSGALRARFRPRACLARGLKTEAGAHRLVRLTAHGLD
ncbi:MAG: hypothetical protein F4Y08_00350 [Caldilineaceae bacterium SB0662_bin_9]|uniref:Uncharacterized protein n=1 Tax=Caldilineaceae bacterium SB0662_bin_9 TaxID=2605258 RepID=A0A6B1DMT4_9CHLR|nr:hypothetical protein [Caldilineaceae bacterium]MXZ41228.1 hypothetical protein [Caldilineaceae bacterium SB0666_bin_21]MYD88780.1 hypothetical protein [Caldilineaceae bacterium SB0662_bin_9]